MAKTVLRTADLKRALEADDAASVEAALDRGWDPADWFDLDSSEAPLAVAISAGSVGCVEALLEAGADWSLQAPYDEDQTAPLALAVESGNADIQMAFIRRGLVAAYALEWLRDSLGGLVTRPVQTADLEFLEALIERPGSGSRLGG